MSADTERRSGVFDNNATLRRERYNDDGKLIGFWTLELLLQAPEGTDLAREYAKKPWGSFPDRTARTEGEK